MMLEIANMLSIPHHPVEKNEMPSGCLLNSMQERLAPQPAKGQFGWINARRQYRGKSQTITTENR